MEEAIRVINRLEGEGVIGRYAIAGAVAMIYYTEPTHTKDLGIFCYIPSQASKLIVSLDPIYSALRQLAMTNSTGRSQNQRNISSILKPSSE